MALTITPGPGVLDPGEAAARRPSYQPPPLSDLRKNKSNVKPGKAFSPAVEPLGSNNLVTGGPGESLPSPAPANTVNGGAGRNTYTGPQPQDYANIDQFSDKQLRDIIEFGANQATPEERAATRRRAEQILASRRPVTTPPSGHGMGSGGGQQGVQIIGAPQNPSINDDFQVSPEPAPGTTSPGGPGIQPPPTPGGTPPSAGPPNPVPPDPGRPPMTLQELAEQAGGVSPGSGTPGDGGTNFNPGGGTNPDGTNPTVPQGNPNNNTAPSVYQLLSQADRPYTTGDPAMDAIGEAVAEGVMGGQIAWNDLSELQRDQVLAGIDRKLATDPNFWTKWGDGDPERHSAVNFIKERFEERYGDPTQQSRGAADNTINEDGSVQGQYDPETGRAFQAISSDAARVDREVTDKELSSQQLTDILASDNPLMMLAKQDAVDQSQQAGLRNSSLAAGNAMREMTRQATPLAMQQAGVYNVAAENDAQREAARRALNAQLQTQTSQFNAGTATDLMNADRQREMQYNLQQLAGDQDYAKQQLAASTAVDVANVEGQYKELISQNDTAARMFDSYYQTVQSVMGNSEFDAGEANGRVRAAREEFEAGMEMILGFEAFDLQNPGAGGGSGSGPGEPSDNPHAAQWDQLPEQIRQMWAAAGYNRDTFPGFGT